MSREDTHETYDHGETEVVELGVDHNGEKQWYISTRDGWEEAGLPGGTLSLSREHFTVGTRVELSEPITLETKT